MPKSNSGVFFLVLVAIAAGFVWLTSQGLPVFVASHFGFSGAANGFMPRSVYVPFMLGFIVLLPLSLVGLTNLTFNNPHVRINLPHREYWLAADRRAATIQFLCDHTTRFGSMLVGFLCYVHWLVVRANATVPPALSNEWFAVGLGIYLVSTAVWTGMLFARFQR